MRYFVLMRTRRLIKIWAFPISTTSLELHFLCPIIGQRKCINYWYMKGGWVFFFYFTVCVMTTVSLINVPTTQLFCIVFSLMCFIHISEPIFPRKWWPFLIFHFLQNGSHSWVISKFSNTLKTTPVTLTCTNTFILTLPSQVSVLWWVTIGTSLNGRWLWQMSILRNLKFTCLKLSLYVLGKFTSTLFFRQDLFWLKMFLSFSSSESFTVKLSHRNHLIFNLFEIKIQIVWCPYPCHF